MHAAGIRRLGPLATPRTLLRDRMGEDLGQERAVSALNRFGQKATFLVPERRHVAAGRLQEELS